MTEIWQPRMSTLPPLVDSRRHYDPVTHTVRSPRSRRSARPAHGGYPTPRREVGSGETVVDAVYACEHGEGYREKLGVVQLPLTWWTFTFKVTLPEEPKKKRRGRWWSWGL